MTPPNTDPLAGLTANDEHAGRENDALGDTVRDPFDGIEVIVSGIGSAPGDDQLTRQLEVCDQLAREEGPVLGVPYLVETPARCPEAGMIGRATALLPGLPTDSQPHGFRLSRGGSASRRRAESLLRGDVESFGAILRSYQGVVKVAVTGPWTLAASLWLPTTERVLSDGAATRDVHQSYAEGVAELVTTVRASLPAAKVMVQFDEPCLPMVTAGAMPTASGLNRVRAVPTEVAKDRLDTAAAAVRDVGAIAVWAHSCAADIPWSVWAGHAFDAVLTDTSLWTTDDLEAQGDRVDAGAWLGLGMEVDDLHHSARRIGQIRDILDVDVRGTVLTPACGLSGSQQARFASAHQSLWDLGRHIADKV